MNILSVDDFERLAARDLPAPVWDFLQGGSGRETTLAANRAAFDNVAVVPRVLRDVTGCSGASVLAGRGSALPVAVAPIAYQRLVHPDGELATARAAAAAGIPFTISTLSSHPLEQIAETGAQTWFQLYWLRDRARRHELVDRAEAAGCTALMLTLDVPWMGRRLRDVRNGFALPLDVTAANLAAAHTAAHVPGAGHSALAEHTELAFAPSLSWDDLAELRRRSRIPLLVKGILDPRDAVRAVECGVDTLVVSNHGGRQLDGAVPSLTALPAVREAIGSRCEVLLDSGIRSGTDVLRALALGADGVLIGRPVLWALAVGGEPGVLRLLRLLAEEFLDALGLAGCARPGEAAQLATVSLRADEGTRRR